MPNYCENDLYVYGPDLDAVRDFVRSNDDRVDDGRVFDLNRIVPMPESVAGTESSTHVLYGLIILGEDPSGKVEEVLRYEWVKDSGVTTKEGLVEFLKKKYPDAVDEAKKNLRALKETGYYDWYDWSIHHWGTKWNTSDGSVGLQPTRSGHRLKFTFRTAWSPPTPVIETLSKRFPKNRFSLRFYERGVGFKGHRRYENGRLTHKSESNYHGRRGG